MVEGKDARPARPLKEDGIELVMYPLNPDGSWKNGIAPPQPKKKVIQPVNEGLSRHGTRVAQLIVPSLHRVDASGELRVSAAREAFKNFGFRNAPSEERHRIEISAARDGGPGIIVRRIEVDHDSSDDVVFIRGSRN